MNLTTFIIVGFILLVFFSCIRESFLYINRIRFELDKKQGLFSSRIISLFLSKPQVFLISVSTGFWISFVFLTIAICDWLVEQYSLLYGQNIIFLIILQVFISFLIIITATGFIPKIFRKINSNDILNTLSIPSLLFFIILFPFSIVIYKIFKGKPIDFSNELVNDEPDIYSLIKGKDDDKKEGKDFSDEMILIQNAIEFTNVKVRDCMIPRPEIVAIEINSSIEDLKQRFFQTGYSKILIYENTFDNLVGYVTSKELFKNPAEIAPLLIQIPFVPEVMPARILLHRLIQEHKSMAVVIDEFGGISGLITVEDIIEEIFGEIEDEHDNPELIERKTGEKEYLFSGRLEIEYLNEKYDLKIPESEEYDTLAGFIFYNFQNFPKPNENIVIFPFEFKIIKVTKTRIELVKVKIHSP